MDDGTGIVVVDAQKVNNLPQSLPTEVVPGSYIMVIGVLSYTEPILLPLAKESEQTIIAHKLVDLSEDPNRETLWFLEVCEASYDVELDRSRL